MKALLIDSVDRSVKEIEINDWRGIAPAIGGNCELFTTGGYMPNGDVVLVDDEGLINGTEDFFFMPSLYPTPLAGRAVVLGTKRNGDSCDCKSKPEDFAGVKFLSRLDVIAAVF